MTPVITRWRHAATRRFRGGRAGRAAGLLLTLLGLLVLLGPPTFSAGAARAGAEASAQTDRVPASPLELTLPRIDGTPQPLSDFAGRVLLLVNVASRCGYTPQYEGLEALYERYRERGFVVLGLPANDFRSQEPGSNREIAEFCRSTYGVEFPMFAKLHVRGPQIHPLYALLTGLPEPLGGPIEWNFQKFLVDRRGRVAARFAPATPPEAPEVVSAIERLLDAPAP